MTLRCSCGCTDVKLVWDNGAEYPETRIERFECQDCGETFEKVLTA